MGYRPAPVRGMQVDPDTPCAQHTRSTVGGHVISPALDDCLLRQGTKTGAWLTVLPSTVNETYLGDQE